MKKTLVILITLFTSLSVFSQGIINSGMTGLQLRNTLNANFDTLFNIGSGANSISVKAFGAVGNGITNDVTSVQNALIAAKGRTVIFPPGEYLLNGGVSVTIDTSVTIIGYSATLIGDNIPNAGSILRINGTTYPSCGILTQNVNVNDHYLYYSGGYSFKSGDILQISDDSIWSYHKKIDNDYVVGRMKELVEVSKDTLNHTRIDLSTPSLRNFYISKNARIEKINRNRIIISGFKIIGNNESYFEGIHVDGFGNVDISNNYVQECTYGGIYTANCMNGFIHNNQTELSRNKDIGYGICISSCRDFQIYNNTTKDARHGIVTGGFWGCTGTYIHDNICYSAYNLAGNVPTIGAHAHDFFTTISNNIVYGDGIFITGANGQVLNNTVYQSESNQEAIMCLIGFFKNSANSLIIQGNHLVRIDSTINGGGIMIDSYISTYRNNPERNLLDELIIKDNNIDGALVPIWIYQNLTMDPDTVIFKNMTISGNITTNSKGLSWIGANKTFIDKINMINNTMDTAVSFNGGYMFPEYTGHIKDLNFSNNIVTDVIIRQVDNAIVSGNVFEGKGKVGEFNYIEKTTNVIFNNNIFKDKIYTTDLILFKDIINLTYRNNQVINCLPGLSIKLTNVTNNIYGLTELNISDFGTKGDGVTDDYIPILNALNFGIDHNIPIYFPPGTYKINQSLIPDSITRNRKLVIKGSNAIIDASGINLSGWTNCFYLYGGITKPRVLTADIKIGDTLIYVNTSGMDIRVGDVFQLYSTNVSFGGYKGEWGKIKRIESNRITIYEKTIDNYIDHNTYLVGINCGGINIDGLTIKGSNDWIQNAGMIYINGAKDVYLSNLKIYNESCSDISLYGVYNGNIQNCNLYGADMYGMGYGIAINGSNEVNVSDCTIKGMRHCITTGEGGISNIYPIPTRHTNIFNNTVQVVSYWNGTIDTHNGSESMNIHDNVIFGGINIRNHDVIIKNNIIHGFYQTTIQLIIPAFTPGSHYKSRYEITNNNISIDDTTTQVSILYLWGNSAGSKIDELIINGNVVHTSGGFLSTLFAKDPSINKLRIDNFVLKNNTVTAGSYSWNYPVVYIDSTSIGKLTLQNEKYYQNFVGIWTGINEVQSNAFLLNIQGDDCDTTGYLSVDNCQFYSNIGRPFDVRWAKKLKISNSYFCGPIASKFGGKNLLMLNNNIFEKSGYEILEKTDTSIVSGNYVDPSYLNSISDSSRYPDLRELRTSVKITTTNDGLTTGLLRHESQDILVTSANANYICCLPITTISTIGMKITGYIGSNGFELRPIAAQTGTVYINGVTTNVEAAIPANSTFEVNCIDATHWILKVWDATGTYSAPIPDAI